MRGFPQTTRKSTSRKPFNWLPAAKDMRANALINAAYGRILANGGSADEYVPRILEAKAIADSGSDVSVQITLKAILCHALRLSGRMTEALQMNIEAMDRAHEIVKFDRQTLGFDIEVWLTAMRGQTLVMLGRGDEARPFLDRVLQKPEGDVDAIHYCRTKLGLRGFGMGQPGSTDGVGTRPSRVFTGCKERQSILAGLCTGVSRSSSHNRRKSQCSHRRPYGSAPLRKIAKGRPRE